MERKIREIKIFYENDKQEIKRQHSRIYQDLLEETNQVKILFHSYLFAKNILAFKKNGK
jgi:L-rhamnose mutarotase